MAELNLGELFGSVLVFGGPYSNLAATRALEHVARVRNIAQSNIICTGDVVAYCAEPEATVQLLRDWQIPVLMGNCEASLAVQAEDCGCGFAEGTLCSVLSRGWYAYASQQLSEHSRQWMAALPRRILFTLANRSFVVVHGSVRQMNRYIFASTCADEKIDEINASGADVVLAGHSGLPFGQCFGNYAWINAGVIGLPGNDGTQDGWYLLLQPDGHRLKASWHRLHYDAWRSSHNMRAAGLQEYAQTLLTGCWPSMDVLPESERRRQGISLHLQASWLP